MMPNQSAVAQFSILLRLSAQKISNKTIKYINQPKAGRNEYEQ